MLKNALKVFVHPKVLLKGHFIFILFAIELHKSFLKGHSIFVYLHNRISYFDFVLIFFVIVPQ